MKRKNHLKRSKRSITLLVSVILLICLTVGGTIAFLIDKTETVTNTFTASKVTTQVTETVAGGVKTNVAILNTGDTDAYIRAAVVVTWKNAEGHVHATTPVAGTDYQIHLNIAGSGAGMWLEGNDGFYYYTDDVSAAKVDGEGKPIYFATDSLINSCSYTANAPEGYSLNVEILASGIQSKPDNAFNTSWASSGLTANNGILTSNASN